MTQLDLFVLSPEGGSVEAASGRAPSMGKLKDEVFERYAKCPLGGLPSL
jgi:hypothetical protein